MIKKALLLVGSPRWNRSTSQFLGEYLLDQLKIEGIETDELQIHKMIRTPEKITELLSRVDKADLVILSCPLYVDSIPAAVIKALEIIH